MKSKCGSLNVNFAQTMVCIFEFHIWLKIHNADIHLKIMNERKQSLGMSSMWIDFCFLLFLQQERGSFSNEIYHLIETEIDVAQ